MGDHGKRPVLLNQAAKIVRRRRTADEAGFSVPYPDSGDAPPRFPKIQRRDGFGRNGKLPEVKEVEKPPTKPPPAHRPVKHQSSIRLENSMVNETTVACDWPMSGKERAKPNHVIRRTDDAAGTNVAFPLVYDITHSMSDMGDDQVTLELATNDLRNRV